MVARAALILTDRRAGVRAGGGAAAVALALATVGACAGQAPPGETFVAGSAGPTTSTTADGGQTSTSSSSTTEPDDTRPATTARRAGTTTTEHVLEPLGTTSTRRSASTSTTKKGSTTTVASSSVFTMKLLFDELIKSGLSESVAQCVIDELVRRKFVPPTSGTLSDEDTELLTDVGAYCALKDLGASP